MNQPRKTKIIFNVFDLVLTPYKDDEDSITSNSILKECIEYINNERIKNRKVVVFDRNNGKNETDKRELFVTSISYNHKDKLWKGRIALLRDNRTPLVYNRDNFSITPLSSLGDTSLLETTHFLIDDSGDHPRFFYEYNYHGPRILDLEYYIRQITNKILKSSKSCKAKTHMNSSIKDVLDSMSEVLNFKIKANPNKLAYLNKEIGESFIGNMQALANTVNPVAIRVEATFKSRGVKVDSKFQNLQAVKFVKNLLGKAESNNEILDDIEEFQLEYEKEDGSNDSLNLLKGKVEFEIECELETKGNVKPRSLFDSSMEPFREYIKTLS